MLSSVAGIRCLEDHYEVQGQLGAGAYGIVRLATHKITGQQVAVKTVNKENMNATEVTQHHRELEILKVCQHENVVKLVDFFETQENFFVLMEYIPGRNLCEFMEQREFKLSEAMVRNIGW